MSRHLVAAAQLGPIHRADSRESVVRRLVDLMRRPRTADAGSSSIRSLRSPRSSRAGSTTRRTRSTPGSSTRCRTPRPFGRRRSRGIPDKGRDDELDGASSFRMETTTMKRRRFIRIGTASLVAGSCPHTLARSQDVASLGECPPQRNPNPKPKPKPKPPRPSTGIHDFFLEEYMGFSQGDIERIARERNTPLVIASGLSHAPEIRRWPAGQSGIFMTRTSSSG